MSTLCLSCIHKNKLDWTRNCHAPAIASPASEACVVYAPKEDKPVGGMGRFNEQITKVLFFMFVHLILSFCCP